MKFIKNNLVIIIIVFVYFILSFYKLGSIKNPNTFYHFNQMNDSILIKLSNKVDISKIRSFSGVNNGLYLVYGSNDNKNYDYITEIKHEYVFHWYDTNINKKYQYIKIYLDEEDGYIGEIGIYSGKDLIKYETKHKQLSDEQDVIPDRISYMNSTYFDEVYFARSAYEYVNQLSTYEWVHPPLGKIIMSIPIYFMGMSPFSYRLMGNIAGILMIVFMYLFGLKMFKNKRYASICAILMAFDNFHFVQTRIGTVDSFLCLFILMAVYFMYSYVKEDYQNYYKRVLLLFLSGVTIGCAIAIKWSALFAGLSLCIVYFVYLYQKKRTSKWKREDIKIIIWSILFFVIIPLTIYVMSYLLFPDVSIYHVSNLKELINCIKGMYKYHSTLDATHPFSSNFYTWPIMLKPVWYYVSYNGNLKGTITSIGNPMIWWIGCLTFIYTFYKVFKNDYDALFIIITIICLFIPYIKIGRIMFLYHYFPVLPFVMMTIVICLKDIEKKYNHDYVTFTYILLVIVFFILFYPITSGMMIDKNIIECFKWLPTWIF